MRRSSEQHNYEWLCYRIIAAETGDTTYSVYTAFVKHFLKEVDENGKVHYRKPTSLEDWEHSIYMQQIHHFIAQFYPDFVWPEKNDIMQPVLKNIE